MSFNCTKCGLCCQSVENSELTIFLSRGDGICRFYDEIRMMCKIYDSRPDICRIEYSYVKFTEFKNIQEYFLANEKVCKDLQEANKF